MSTPKWQIGALSDVGVKRRGRPNEDSIGVFFATQGPYPPLLIVADGMGGYQGGATASQTVIGVFEREYPHLWTNMPPAEALGAMVHAAQSELQRMAQGNDALSSMGSTVVVAVLTSRHVSVANVGDSRAYLLHGSQLSQLSEDHSKVAALERAGILTAEDARAHPERNMLLMSLSARRREVKPYITQTQVVEGDSLLLCSDGLWNTVSNSEIEAVLAEMDPQAAAEKLVALANMSGAPDNVSVIVARLGERVARSKDDDEDKTDPIIDITRQIVK